MMRRMQRILPLLAALLAGTHLHAQAARGADTLKLPFQRITIEDGLSQGMVGSIIQDRAGFMWFATKDGLNRYDGYSFKVFRHDPQDSTSVRDSYILSLLEDSEGLIWVGTNSGLDVFDPATEIFHHFACIESASDARTLPSCMVTTIIEDPSGHIWSTIGNTICRITPDRTTPDIAGPGTRVRTLATNRIDNMSMDHRGNLLVVAFEMHDGISYTINDYLINTGDEERIASMARNLAPMPPDLRIPLGKGSSGIWAAADRQRQVSHILMKAGPVMEWGGGPDDVRQSPIGSPEWGRPFAAFADTEGHLWAATTTGLWRCDPMTGRTSAIRSMDGLHGEGSQYVVCFHQDRNGVIWVGTAGYGIYTHDPRVERFNTQRTGSTGWMTPRADGRILMYAGAQNLLFDPRDKTNTVLPPLVITWVDGSGLSAYQACFAEAPTDVLWTNAGRMLRRQDERDGHVRRFGDPSIPMIFRSTPMGTR